MSEIRDQVLDAIDNGARTSGDIVEATGLEKEQVYQAVFQLKSSGQIVKGAEGLQRCGEAPPQRRRIHEASEAVAEPSEPARKKRARRTNGHAALPIPASVSSGAQPVAFARFGEYVVLRTKDVADLLSTIERWRGVLEAR